MFKIIIFFACLLLSPDFVFSDNISPIDSSFDSVYVSGRVIDVYDDDEQGQKIYITQLKDGSIIELDSYGESIPVGERIYLEYFKDQDLYNFVTVNRNHSTVLLLLIFITSIIFLTKKKGVRSLLSLLVSMIVLFFGLVPLLLNGFDPVWTTIIFGLCVLFLSIFFTHGFNRQSLVSFLGSFGSILLGIFLIHFITEITSLTGLINEEIQFLSFEVENSINLVRLVSASIIIGILGVLDDITITQVAVVRELSSNHELKRNTIFTKALRVGRDHISSLVNTLVFAYLGATLPMIMFISLLDIPFLILISQEFIFVEIIRSLIGAISLTLAVPLTTWLAVYVFLGAIKKDACSLESPCGHHHH